MENASPDDTTLTARRPAIADRLQTGALVLAAILLATGVVDVWRRPGGIVPVAWIYLCHLALVALVLIATRRAPVANLNRLAAAAVMVWNALFCSYALHTPQEMSALVAPSIVLLCSAAMMFPWGIRTQALVSLVCVLTYLGACALSGRSADLGMFYACMSLAGAAVISCAGAYVIDQHGRIIDEQTCRLTEQNRLMREAGVRKDEFLASVSHELRTPLNVVLGYVDLLLEHSFGPLEPSQRDILHRITKNASNLSHLINDLIDLSRIDAGRLKVEIASVELAPLFGDMRSVMEVLLGGHDVIFESHLAPACGRVLADPDRLKQIVSNLLVNAVKFTEQGSITLRAEPREGYVAVTVSDTGIGIPEAAHRAIFEPFRQVHDRSRRAPGAGIGLSISSRLAHLMGGTLVVASEPGRGSQFTLTVPRAPADAESDAAVA
ncbi:MAG TPA: HAMP domain-containing sensor histidine kinase [Candidatus Binatia bacterium]|jgi:signal transduction histidine kinase